MNPLLLKVGLVVTVILARRRNLNPASATPGEADVVYPSTPGDVDSAGGPVVPDGDDPATPVMTHSAVGPPDASVIKVELIQR